MCHCVTVSSPLRFLSCDSFVVHLQNDRIIDRNSIKMSAIDYMVTGNTTKLFIVSQLDGAIYQHDLPVKLSYPSAGSSNKDKGRLRRDTPSGLKRVNVSHCIVSCWDCFSLM